MAAARLVQCIPNQTITEKNAFRINAEIMRSFSKMAHANHADRTLDPRVMGTNVKLTSANQASEI